jgi:TRAP-type uncharacterized transport system fused permease subunit
MQGEPLSIIYTTLTAALGVYFISAGVFGYLIKPANILERIIFMAGGLLLFIPGVSTDLVGAALAAVGYISQRLRRSAAVPTPGFES